MTAAVPATPRVAPARIRRWSRIYGLGSVYAKTLRDSRLAIAIVTGLTAGVLFAVSSAISQVFPTQAARDEIVRLATEMGGIAQGVVGKPVNLGSLGGYVQWKYGPLIAIVAASWSILVLSGTLAAEARRGSLELVAVTPIARRRLALEKLAAHLTGMVVLVTALMLSAFVAGAAFRSLPIDAIPLDAAIGFALWVGCIAISFGAFAFAASQFVGRASAAGIAGALLIAGWILSNYQATMTGFPPVASLTPWGWTLDHLPLAGQPDWPSLLLPAGVAILLLVIGVEAFARRDLGSTSALPMPGLPVATLGLGGPVARSFGERLPVAVAWGLGVGALGLMLSGISRVVADAFRASPDLHDLFGRMFPGLDIGTVGGFLQLMVQLLYIIAGFAAATLVAGWASDETAGRLEMLLTTPLGRRRWALRSAAGVLLAIGAMALLVAAGVGIGALASGGDALAPCLGALALGAYAAALAGVGFAVGGLRASIAAEAVAALVIATYLVDLLAPAFGLPAWVHQLALTSHLGQPMVGAWDWVGIGLCVAMAVGGTLVGAWAIGRRDVAR